MAKKVSFCHSRFRLYFDYIIILSQHSWTYLDIFSLIFRLYFAYIPLIFRLYFAYISLIRHELSQQKRHLLHPGFFIFSLCRNTTTLIWYVKLTTLKLFITQKIFRKNEVISQCQLLQEKRYSIVLYRGVINCVFAVTIHVV